MQKKESNAVFRPQRQQQIIECIVEHLGPAPAAPALVEDGVEVVVAGEVWVQNQEAHCARLLVEVDAQHCVRILPSSCVRLLCCCVEQPHE